MFKDHTRFAQTIFLVNEKAKGEVNTAEFLTSAKRIHCQFDLCLQSKLDNCDEPQIELYERLIDQYRLYLKQAKNISELIIELDVQHFEEMSFYTNLKKFILEEIIQQHSSTIEKLTFKNCNLNFLLEELEEGSTSDPIQDLLQSLIVPLKNLKSLGINDRLNQRSNIQEDSLCKRFTKLYQEKKELFENIDSFQFGFIYEFESITTKKISPNLFNYIYSFAQLLPQLESMKRLKLVLNNLELDTTQFSKLNTTLIKCEHLKSLKLDYQQETQNSQNIFETLKTFQKLSKSLEVFHYCDVNQQQLKVPEVKQLSAEISKFNNLTAIGLKKFSAGPGSLIEFVSSFKNFTQLNKLTLDLTGFAIKPSEMVNSFALLGKSVSSLKKLEIILPKEQKVTGDFVAPMNSFISQQGNTLEKLKISLKATISLDAFVGTFEQLEYLPNLTYLGIFLLKNGKVDDQIIFNSKLSNVATIYDYKRIEWDGVNWNHQYALLQKLALSYLTKFQKSSFEELRIDYYYSKKSNDNIAQNMSTIQRIDKLKHLKVSLQNQEEQKTIALSQLLEGSRQSLESFSGETYIQKEDFNRILACSNLNSLTLYLNKEISDNPIKDICSSLPKLLRLQTEAHFSNEVAVFDCSDILHSDYLMDIDLKRMTLQNQQVLKLGRERKSTLHQLILYQKLIQPYIIYQKNSSHWDLFY